MVGKVHSEPSRLPGVFDTTTLQSRGIVRLAFNANAQVTLDASLQLQLSGVTFTLELPFAGPLVILPVGSVFASGTNCVILSDLSNGSFAADIFVTGGSGSAVAAGTSSTFSATIPGLVSAVAIADFDKGNPVSGIANAAARTQQSFVSATPASRQGITKMLNNEYPDLVGSSVSLPGDPTNTRSTVSALGFGNPAVDIFIHSTQYGLLQTQRVLLPLVASQGGHTINKFIGQLSLIERPMQITQVVSAQVV